MADLFRPLKVLLEFHKTTRMEKYKVNGHNQKLPYPFSPFNDGDIITIVFENDEMCSYTVNDETEQQGSQIKFDEFPNIFERMD